MCIRVQQIVQLRAESGNRIADVSLAQCSYKCLYFRVLNKFRTAWELCQPLQYFSHLGGELLVERRACACQFA